MDAQLRKYKNVLSILGIGVLVFAVWSIIKTIIYNILNPVQNSETEEYSPVVALILFVVLAGILLADLAFRVFICISTRNISKGKSKGNLCLVISIVMTTFYLGAIPLEVSNLSYSISFIDTITTMIIDITSMVLFIGIILCVIKIKTLTSKTQEKEA